MPATKDTVARLGRDEFAILLQSVAGANEAAHVAQRVAVQLEVPFAIGQREVFLSTSIGVALGAPGHDPGSLMRDADTAMYRAKNKGKARFEMFEEDMSAHVFEHLELEADLRRAIERQEEFVTTSPNVELATGRIANVEALVRWKHPRRGLVFPTSSSHWPKRRHDPAARPLGARRSLPASPRVAAAVPHGSSPQDEREPFREAVPAPRPGRGNRTDPLRNRPRGIQPGPGDHRRRRHGGRRVDRRDAPKAEIFGRAASNRRLRHGYSSLSYLKRFPVDSLKIDKSFVDGLGQNPEDPAIVGAVSMLARTLGMRVTAAGVERADQLARLKALGCELGQRATTSPARCPPQRSTPSSQPLPYGKQQASRPPSRSRHEPDPYRRPASPTTPKNYVQKDDMCALQKAPIR